MRTPNMPLHAHAEYALNKRIPNMPYGIEVTEYDERNKSIWFN
jgi:hypothetical protein